MHSNRRELDQGQSLAREQARPIINDHACVQELVRRWYPELHNARKETWSGESAHRSVRGDLRLVAVLADSVLRSALDDIRASIRELEYYKQHVFIPQRK